MAECRLEQSGPVLVAYLSGEIDHHAAGRLREQIDARILSAVSYTHLAQALAKAEARGGGFCVCGSFYLAGEARRLLGEGGKLSSGLDSL